MKRRASFCASAELLEQMFSFPKGTHLRGFTFHPDRDTFTVYFETEDEDIKLCHEGAEAPVVNYCIEVDTDTGERRGYFT